MNGGKYEKKILIVITLSVIILLSIYIGFNAYQRNEDNIIKLTLYPTGMVSDCFLFSINSKGELKIYFGVRNHENINKNNFLRRGYKKEKIQLSVSELQEIIDLANKVDESDEKIVRIDVWGGMDGSLLYNNKNYDFHRGAYGDNKIGELIHSLTNEIINHSSIPVKEGY